MDIEEDNNSFSLEVIMNLNKPNTKTFMRRGTLNTDKLMTKLFTLKKKVINLNNEELISKKD